MFSQLDKEAWLSSREVLWKIRGQDKCPSSRYLWSVGRVGQTLSRWKAKGKVVMRRGELNKWRLK